jgi:hypothetical protein
VLYFLAPSDVATVAVRALAALDTDGAVLSVNWRGLLLHRILSD